MSPNINCKTAQIHIAAAAAAVDEWANSSHFFGLENNEPMTEILYFSVRRSTRIRVNECDHVLWSSWWIG